jgi:hypothetical protein
MSSDQPPPQPPPIRWGKPRSKWADRRDIILCILGLIAAAFVCLNPNVK